MPPSGLRDVLGEPGEIPATPEKVNVGMPAELLRRRPDIRRAELDAATQSAQIGIAQTDLYPRFSLFGSIGLQTSSHGGPQSNSADTNDFFSSDSITYGVGPSFQWPIFNYGRLRNNVRVQDARYQQLVVNYQNSVLEAAREVEDGLVGFLKSQEQARFLTDSVKAGERSVELSVIQYRDGAVDYQRVIDSQTALTTRQDRWTVARGNAVLNLVATYAALGGGWQIRDGKDPIRESIQEEMRTRTNWGKLLPPDTPPATLDPPPPAREQKFFNRPDW